MEVGMANDRQELDGSQEPAPLDKVRRELLATVESRLKDASSYTSISSDGITRKILAVSGISSDIAADLLTKPLVLLAMVVPEINRIRKDLHTDRFQSGSSEFQRADSILKELDLGECSKWLDAKRSEFISQVETDERVAGQGERRALFGVGDQCDSIGLDVAIGRFTSYYDPSLVEVSFSLFSAERLADLEKRVGQLATEGLKQGRLLKEEVSYSDKFAAIDDIEDAKSRESDLRSDPSRLAKFLGKWGELYGKHAPEILNSGERQDFLARSVTKCVDAISREYRAGVRQEMMDGVGRFLKAIEYSGFSKIATALECRSAEALGSIFGAYARPQVEALCDLAYWYRDLSGQGIENNVNLGLKLDRLNRPNRFGAGRYLPCSDTIGKLLKILGRPSVDCSAAYDLDGQF